MPNENLNSQSIDYRIELLYASLKMPSDLVVRAVVRRLFCSRKLPLDIFFYGSDRTDSNTVSVYIFQRCSLKSATSSKRTVVFSWVLPRKLYTTPVPLWRWKVLSEQLTVSNTSHINFRTISEVERLKKFFILLFHLKSCQFQNIDILKSTSTNCYTEKVRLKQNFDTDTKNFSADTSEIILKSAGKIFGLRPFKMV